MFYYFLIINRPKLKDPLKFFFIPATSFRIYGKDFYLWTRFNYYSWI